MTNQPALSDKDIGHIRRLVKLSRQLPGDWSGMGSDWWDIGERSLQYQLSFGAYLLGLVQYHYTPAYRELCQPTIDALIQKMTLPDVWESWINASRGGSLVNPDQKELGPGWIDPIKKYNLMLKGHLLQMAALYEALYHDGKYTKPGAFTFEFRATTWGNGPETFKYDLHDVARIIYQEYVESKYEGCQCEPNRVFPMCNQHSVLGLIHYDHVHGTAYASDVIPKFKAAWLRKGYTDMGSKSHMRMRFVAQDKIVPADTPWSDGWTGAFMHAWDPDFIEALYPHERERHLENLLKGRDAARVYDSMVPTSAKIGLGMFALLASEVGDAAAQESLLAYADKNFNPIWSNGEYYFPRSDDWMPDENGNYHGVDMLTGNALLPMARINFGNGLRKFYSNPPKKDYLDDPFISDVDQPAVGVAQAYYDHDEAALHLSLLPVRQKVSSTSFKIRQLDPARSYRVIKDHQDYATLSPGARKNTLLKWQPDGSVEIETDLDARHAFIIAAI